MSAEKCTAVHTHTGKVCQREFGHGAIHFTGLTYFDADQTRPAPTQVAQADETLAAWFSNEGDGGIWESFDNKNSRIVAEALLRSSWLAAHVATIRADAEQAAARALVAAADEIEANSHHALAPGWMVQNGIVCLLRERAEGLS